MEEIKDYTKMSNSEIKLHLESINMEFEAKKAKAIKLFEEMKQLQNEYAKVENEIKIRREIYL